MSVLCCQFLNNNVYIYFNVMRQYVLIDSESKDISVYTRADENEWMLKLYKNTSEKIKIGDCEIAIEDIYKKVKF